MVRVSRFNYIVEDGVYHVMSRIALDKIFDDEEKDVFLRIIKHFSKIYFCKVFAYSIMGNHFHLIVQMNNGQNSTPSDFQSRYKRYTKVLSFVSTYSIHKKEDREKLKIKWTKLSELVKDIKLSFTRYYNAKHARRGYLWGGRFKSVFLQKGEALVNCMAYIDLNPVRAGLVNKPEDYKWNSMYYHVVSKNKDKWLSLDYANPYQSEYNPINKQKSNNEKLIFYRKFMYQVGNESHFRQYGKNVYKDIPIDDKVLEDAEKNDFQYTFKDRFMHRCRYFSDSLIIGSHDFVKLMHSQYKNMLFDKRKRRFPKMKSYENIYSMRELRSDLATG